MKRKKRESYIMDDAFIDFIDNHKCLLGRLFSRSFDIKVSNEGGLGINVFLKCNRCGREVNVTNYEGW